MVTPQMPAKFQRREVVVQSIYPLILAMVVSTPFFFGGHWMMAIGLVAVWFVGMLAIQNRILWKGAEQGTDGTLYIPPSVQSVRVMMAFMFPLFLTALMFKVLGYYMGLPI